MFKPTYLYIKQHTKTGKLYFGKTIRDPISYLGSGIHWRNHIKKHGKEFVINFWYKLYDNPFDLVADALSMSIAFDIVKNHSWLNSIPETGLSGCLSGENHPQYKVPLSEKRKLEISMFHKGRKKSLETRLKMSKPKSKEHIRNNALARTGRKASIHSRINQSKRIDVLLPCGLVLHDTTRLELSITYNLNYASLKKYFLFGKSYKGFHSIT